MIRPDKDSFMREAKPGTIVPVYTEILADEETPVSAFQKAASGRYSYLLESVESGVNIGRYSIIGTGPKIIFKATRKDVSVTVDGETERTRQERPLAYLEEVLGRYKPVASRGLDLPFWGGAVGYVGYDHVRFFEKLPERDLPGAGMPDVFFVVMKDILVFDQLKHKIFIVHNAFIDSDPEKSYQQAVIAIERILEGFQKGRTGKNLFFLNPDPDDGIYPDFDKQAFLAAVRKIKEYIRAGDIFQCVLSQRFHTRVNVAPFNIYRALRVINPSPYMFYIHFGDIRVIGSSPEVMVRKTGTEVMVKPIAGTRPRGANEEEDRGLEQELLKDRKELAEHLMLVDLGRNDIGRIAVPGSVHVEDFMTIERYSHVMHIVSTVLGKIRPGVSLESLVRATFPAGTVSGAPKIRAMEIIEELEPVRRGIYSGLVGYYSFSGNFDSCITIRTMVQKDDRLYIQAGAGIVADSRPEKEYEETMNKIKALFRSIETARGGLQ